MRRPRDLDLLDRIDQFPRISLEQNVWRVVREGRNPLTGAASLSRWCNGAFDVLYTSTERDGAIAEIYSLFTSQPVFPSRISVVVHRIVINVPNILCIESLESLTKLGVTTATYKERHYQRTQDIADAALFLGFTGLMTPSARWQCSSVVLFGDHITQESLTLAETEPRAVSWEDWRKKVKRL